METSEPRLEKVIEKVLSGSEWGIREDLLFAERARARGKALFRHHWVDKSELPLIEKVFRARGAVQFVVALGWIVVTFLTIGIAVPYFITYGSPGMPPVVFSFVLATLFLTAAVFHGLRRMRRWARNAVVFISVLAFVPLTILSVPAAWRLVGANPGSALLLMFVGFLLPLLILTGVLHCLLNKTVTEIFRVQGSLIDRDRADRSVPPQWRTPVVFAAVVLLNVGLDIAYSRWWASRPPSRNTCDRAASADTSRLGACLERFGDELALLDCGRPANPFDRGLMLDYLVGPYYGWGGTTGYGQVLVRVVGDEVRACSPLGSRPAGPASRYIYRCKAYGGMNLPTTQGPCLGQAYGGQGDKCYKSSAACDKCRACEPKEWVRCEKPRDWP